MPYTRKSIAIKKEWQEPVISIFEEESSSPSNQNNSLKLNTSLKKGLAKPNAKTRLAPPPNLA